MLSEKQFWFIFCKIILDSCFTINMHANIFRNCKRPKKIVAWWWIYITYQRPNFSLIEKMHKIQIICKTAYNLEFLSSMIHPTFYQQWLVAYQKNLTGFLTILLILQCIWSLSIIVISRKICLILWLIYLSSFLP